MCQAENTVSLCLMSSRVEFKHFSSPTVKLVIRLQSPMLTLFGGLDKKPIQEIVIDKFTVSDVYTTLNKVPSRIIATLI